MPVKAKRKLLNAAFEKSKSTPISISRTEGEWDFIQAKIKEIYRGDLTSYIHSEIKKISDIFQECPTCITHAHGRKVEKQPWISSISLKKLEEIAVIMQKPVSSVIQEFIIVPLLQQERE